MKLRSLLSAPFAIGLALGAASTVFGATLGSAIFSDVPSGAYYDQAVGTMYDRGIIKGYPDGRFGPGDLVTRADVAVMMDRLRNDILGINPTPTPSSSSSSSRSSSSRSSSSSSSSVSSSSSSLASVPNEGAFQFTVTGISIPESAKSVSISVKRIGDAEGDVTVKYTSTGTTATSGLDFTPSSGTLSFKDGETSKTISVSLKEDTLAEGVEKFNVVLSNPTGGAALNTPTTVIVSILDNEAPNSSSSSSSTSGGSSSSSSVSANSAGSFGFSASTYSIEEDLGTLTVTVVRYGGTNGTAAVNYATSAGTASNSTKYTDTSGTLTFSGGESSKTFTVQVKDDASIIGNKTFNLTLSSPTGGAVLGNPKTATAIIVDDEAAGATASGSFRFGNATYSGTEGQTLAVYISRFGDTNKTASVSYNISGGIAVSGTDYTLPPSGASATLSFAPGEETKVLLIPLIDDNASEPEESTFVTLSSPVNGVLGSVTSTTIKIQD